MPPTPTISFRWRHLGTAYAFQVQAPYSEGHVLTRAEAQALNVLRSENIQNNLRQAFADEAGKCVENNNLLTQEALDRVQEIVSKYDENYQFVEAHEPKPKLGALEREARNIAIGKLEDGASEEEIAALAETIDVLTEARERLEAQARIASSSMEDLLG